VRHSGKTYAHPLAVVTVTESSSENVRVGIITGKSIGNAVKRNLAKRRIRKIFSDHLINFQQAYDIVVIARPAISDASYEEIEKAISGLLKKARLLN
jgi:ribonuclease P protein component